MSAPPPEIRSVPVDLITILNPRVRNKRIFQELVNSIAHLGLKKPITVSQRPGKTRFDLVCGQGRLEAFIALGQTEIPAIVIDAAEEDCYVMSLVENLARRQHSPLELVHAIGALSAQGYSHPEIAAKVDFSVEYVSAICLLLENGEEKLIAAVERGVIPHSIAMEIARAKEGEVQQALAQAYEEKSIPGNQVLAIRQIIEQRNTSGKQLHKRGSRVGRTQNPVTSESLIRAYQRETERQKLLIKRASLARSRLLFVANAMRRLSAEQMGRLEREMASVSEDYKELEVSYGDDMLVLVVASGFIERLLAKPEIEGFLAGRHPEFLVNFRAIVQATSLDQSTTP